MPRRDDAGARVVALPRRAVASAATRRVALEDMIHRAIEELDALDARFADREPDGDEDGGDAEASHQPATLAPDRLPARVVRLPRVPA